MRPINLSFNQYLLDSEEPLLIQTGNVQQAAALLPELQTQLKDKHLKYIFVSHFESDECGGLSVLMEHYPEAIVICSATTARQLSGFGIRCETFVKQPGEKLTTAEWELEFISYPSEMHLWEGLLAFETQCKIFFSSDLMMRPGEAAGEVIKADWREEIAGIKPAQVPDPERRAMLQDALGRLPVEFVATGHGACLKV